MKVSMFLETEAGMLRVVVVDQVALSVDNHTRYTVKDPDLALEKNSSECNPQKGQ